MTSPGRRVHPTAEDPMRAHRSRRPRVAASVVAAVLGTALVGAPASGSAAARPAGKLSGSITVSAAASLTEAFGRIGERFEREHPDVSVTFNFASSGTLATQVLAGAPADVLAAADLATMDRLLAAGRVRVSPAVFARNVMEIAVKPGNPERVRKVADLVTIGTVALCGGTAPCATYAATLLARAGVTIPTDRITRGQDAKATLSAVSVGDADAALVYATDVRAAGRTVDGVPIPERQNVVAVYPIAPVAGSSSAAVAKAFTAYVTSPAGQRILARSGFLGA